MSHGDIFVNIYLLLLADTNNHHRLFGKYKNAQRVKWESPANITSSLTTNDKLWGTLFYKPNANVHIFIFLSEK